MSGARYLYALVQATAASAPVTGVRVGGRRYALLPVASGLWAVAGAPPKGEGLDALRAHDDAVRALHRRFDALLPFRFDTRVDSDPALKRALSPQAKALRSALSQVKFREQMALRLVGAPPEVKPAKPGRTRPSPKGAGTAFLEARAVRLKVPELDGVREAVRDLVMSERTARPEQGPLQACVYHLVERGAAGAYRDAAERAGFTHEGLRLVVSGPDPAWAFAPEVDAWR